MANNAAVLKTMIAAAAEACVAKFRLDHAEFR